MASFTNNTVSNIVFDSSIFDTSDNLSSKNVSYVYSNSSDSNDIEIVDLDDEVGEENTTIFDDISQNQEYIAKEKHKKDASNAVTDLLDFNGDGKFDKKDITFLLQSNNISETVTQNDINNDLVFRADINNDGVFDDNDISLMKQGVESPDLLNSDVFLIKNRIIKSGYKNPQKIFNSIFQDDFEMYKNKFKENHDYNKDGIIDDSDRKYFELKVYEKELKDISEKNEALKEYIEYLNGSSYSDKDSLISYLNNVISSNNDTHLLLSNKYKNLNIVMDMTTLMNEDSEYQEKKNSFKDSIWGVDRKICEDAYKYYSEHGNLNNWNIKFGEEEGKKIDMLAVWEYLANEHAIFPPTDSMTHQKLNGMTSEQRREYHRLFMENGLEAAEHYYAERQDEIRERSNDVTHHTYDSQFDKVKYLSDEQRDYYLFLCYEVDRECAYSFLVEHGELDCFGYYNKKVFDCDITNIEQKEEKDYINEYLSQYVDLNNDKKIDEKDTNLLADRLRNNYVDDLNIDFNGDGQFDKDDYTILNNYLENGESNFITDSYEYNLYKNEKLLNEYTVNRDKLQKISKEFYNDEFAGKNMESNEREYIANQINEKITNYNILIKSQKKMVNMIPYYEKMAGDDYKKFCENYVPNWDDTVDYEAIYEDFNDDLRISSSYGGKDRIAIIEYLINVKGMDLSKYGDFDLKGTYQNYMAMTSDQRNMYHYLFKTEGYDAAEKYFETIKDDINCQKGKMKAEEIIKNMDHELKIDENGYLVGIELTDSLRNKLNSMVRGTDKGMTGVYSGMFEWGKENYSVEEYQDMYLLQYLMTNDSLKNLYQAGQMIGSAETLMAITTFLSFSSPAGMSGLLSLAANNTMGVLSAGGSAQHSLLVEGYSMDTANIYAKKIMANTLASNLASGVVGYGFGATLKFTEMLKGFNGIGNAIHLASSFVETFVGAHIEALTKKQEIELQRCLLGKSITISEENEELNQAFMDSIVMSAISSGQSVVFNAMLKGETLQFSSDDWLDYLKSSDSPTVEDFVNSYSGKVLTSSGEWVSSEPISPGNYSNDDVRSFWNSYFGTDKSEFNPVTYDVSDMESAKNAFNDYQDLIDAELKKDNPDLRFITEYQSMKNELNQKYHLEEQFQLASAEKGASKRFTTAAEPETKEIANAISDFRNKTRETRKVKVGDKYFETDLTDAELIKFANDYHHGNIPKGMKTISSIDDYPVGFGVPKSSDYVKISPSDGKMSVVWGENDGALYGANSGGASLKKGSYVARVGNSNGINVCSYENAESVDYSNTSSRRGLPWSEGSATNTTWSVEKDITASSVLADLENLQKTNPAKYEKIMGDISYDLYGNSGVKATLKDIKCLTGLIAPDFGGVGLDTQYTLPIRTSHLEYLGYIKVV